MKFPHGSFRRNLKITQVLLMAFSPFLTLALPLIFVVGGLSSEIDLTHILSTLFAASLRYFFDFEFLFACTTVRLRFKLLNQRLSHVIKKGENQYENFARINVELEKVFGFLCDAIQQSNEYFTFTFLFQYPYMVVRKS